MKLEIHSLYWPNTDSRIVDAHQRVLRYFNIPVNYHMKQIDHGQWMDETIKNSSADIIGFLDIDAVPLNREKFFECIDYVKKNKTFLGIAQVSNHLHIKSYIYCAPAFFIIHKECWNMLNTSFQATYERIEDKLYGADVAENLSHRADELGIKYKGLLPSRVYKPKWRLGSVSSYGIGTIFSMGLSEVIYHLYESRNNENVELFEEHCQQIIDDELDFSKFHKATEVDL